MNTLTIFDPALCCSTGVCGPTPDSALAAFASTLETLKASGVAVTRHNLAQEPLAFAQHPEVKAILAADGDSALPLIFVNDTLALRGTYPTLADLQKSLNLPTTKQPLTFQKVAAPKPTLTNQSSCCDPSSGCC